MSITVIVLVGIAFVAIIVVFALLFRNSDTVNMTGNKEDKPDWLRNMPPAETLDTLLAKGKKVTVFDYDEGEKVAAPFTEQIEDIFRAKVKADPSLTQYQVDLGSAPDGTLEFWVNDKKYSNVNDLPDNNLKRAFRESVRKWNN
ncbi:MAG TPA: hypothetical protein VLA72_00640 [Anaerolineales bacterium]|nr:hypothetical protein [Anaerolineales bacterium]